MTPNSAFSLGVGSALPGLRFPALPAAHVLPRLAMFQQLEASQWLAPEALRDWQFAQLDALLRHVRATVPAYRFAGDLECFGKIYTSVELFPHPSG